jgi:hypothetical protein
MNEALQAWQRRHGIGFAAMAELHALLRPSVVVPPDMANGGADHARLLLDESGGSLWRNNSGALPDETGRIVRYGLWNDSKALNAVVKSSDYIGIAPGGRFLAVEWKPRGWKLIPSDARGHAQKAFLDIVRKLGGIATFASRVEDVTEAINRHD